MKNKEDELFESFTKQVFKMNTINFIGISKLMGVKLANDTGDSLRPMEDIVADIFNAFAPLSNSKKKEIIKLCKQANKSGGKNGNRAKDLDQQIE